MNPANRERWSIEDCYHGGEKSMTPLAEKEIKVVDREMKGLKIEHHKLPPRWN
ncbi:hypothetical protein HKBW3S42_00783 [Candidatus Hakubella thermalkaliphila]|uniref:Uncharacterized protein n=1 Tax=Candidatus Hakubella thermalkaliphila TaxID=2754717 RepID=A0A6V8PIN1_9ACTN|nr:hypothetical protein HKBW3S42_00783 [Candidatus Hakubella thermalkaliphila]